MVIKACFFFFFGKTFEAEVSLKLLIVRTVICSCLWPAWDVF